METSSGLVSLAETFMSAPLESTGWDRALRELARHTQSARAQLIAIGGAREIPFNCLTDEPSGYYEQFVSIDGGSADANWRVACIREPMVVMAEADYDRVRNHRKFGDYNDLATRLDMENGCQTVLINEGGSFFALAVLKARADGRTTEADRALFAGTAPIARMAVRMQLALEHEGAKLLAGALESMKTAAFVCDSRGRVCAHTAAAERLLGTWRGLTLDQGRLHASRPDEDRRLQDALGDVQGGATQLWLRDAEDPPSAWKCEIFTLPRREWSFGFEPRTLVIVRQPADLDPTLGVVLRQLLDLSPAEAHVSMLVARGMSRAEIASRRGTSLETVSTQIKSVFSKANVRRESELVAQIHKLLR